MMTELRKIVQIVLINVTLALLHRRTVILVEEITEPEQLVYLHFLVKIVEKF